ncbi:SAM hydrolase/SAM-dependent halogenase family protein [Larkinella punicea]|uniref:DNA-directed RNA polymerase subunit delta n=1 Tax=Larkinella punicea TaxID=2315727 RepID=A0A368JXH1_9BACT|nr:S-adenosyl-l-methionine hydroxide adenosyltransferase family protein [Larkinella punicea]RCR71636.1 DNA-directed RNA polymerase subunit delta [Larkinella punicea]
MNRKTALFLIHGWLMATALFAQNGVLVFQSDFGLKDGAVSAMKGVAVGVSPTLKIFDLTHDIPAYNIWEAAYRLLQTAPYYPEGTVFVSVCDPGVGTDRKSVVLLTQSGHYFVTPDNGTLTLIAEKLGIQEVREIDEAVNRLRNSTESYTFHGRDVYAYTGARLAAKVISLAQVGKKLPAEVWKIPYQKPVLENGVLKGTVPVLDVQYGNVWTNIPKLLFEQMGAKTGENLRIRIFNKNKRVFKGNVLFVNTFGESKEGGNVAYFNSLLNFSVAVNRGDFARKYKISSGPDWRVEISK